MNTAQIAAVAALSFGMLPLACMAGSADRDAANNCAAALAQRIGAHVAATHYQSDVAGGQATDVLILTATRQDGTPASQKMLCRFDANGEVRSLRPLAPYVDVPQVDAASIPVG